jgi:hypothetical protein
VNEQETPDTWDIFEGFPILPAHMPDLRERLMAVRVQGEHDTAEAVAERLAHMLLAPRIGSMRAVAGHNIATCDVFADLAIYPSKGGVQTGPGEEYRVEMRVQLRCRRVQCLSK